MGVVAAITFFWPNRPNPAIAIQQRDVNHKRLLFNAIIKRYRYFNDRLYFPYCVYNT
jgi:hypothetical protein